MSSTEIAKKDQGHGEDGRFVAYERSEQTAKRVQTMKGYGLTHNQIAAIEGFSVDTLRRHYANELATGSAIADMNVAEGLYKNATKRNNVTAQIFWLKARAGWKETSVQELTGKDGGAIEMTQTQARQILEQYTPEEREMVRKFLGALRANKMKEVEQSQGDLE